MPDTKKYDRILDALHQLLEDETIQNISVSDIAKKAGIGKGSIYYYFRPKPWPDRQRSLPLPAWP